MLHTFQTRAMKYFLSLILLLSFGTSYCYAQSLYSPPEVHVGERKYKVEVFEGRFPMIGVTNAENSWSKTRQTVSADMLWALQLTQPTSLLNSFWDTFNEDELRELLPEERIIVTFYVNPSGKVIETSFLLKKETKLRPEKLAELEATLKNNVSFSFKMDPRQAKRANFFHFTKPISIAKVLNRNLEWDKTIEWER